MKPQNELPEDPLNAAMNALRETPIPVGPDEILIAATVAALNPRQNVLLPEELVSKQKRRKQIMRILKFGGFSVSTIAAVLVIFVMTSGRSAADDLKKSIRKLDQAKSIRMIVELDDGTKNKMTSRSYMSEGKMRSEVEPAGLVVVINNKGDGKGIVLFKGMKTYRLLDPEKDEMIKSVTKSVKGTLEQFKIPSDDKVQGLPDEYLDGRKTKVYEMKGVDVPGMKITADLKIWIDPKTDMPIRSRVISKMGDKQYTATATYLGFDEELDPKLFDTTIPTDYKPMPELKKD
ncbi:hypothetical protein KIH39_14170 [Telmatocola sphagniphila]|uniref:Uncharacterized protein n=1 Tax=Telmatocola sphagniphila TaxID=1123043 RepID=A0A8E6EWD3_9BACT|nr:hypothetical protein [Telmatocola sphagniphila]QVL30011.1 hypothetical protein KIH39_14170 [Telmatocola sphagniphila]